MWRAGRGKIVAAAASPRCGCVHCVVLPLAFFRSAWSIIVRVCCSLSLRLGSCSHFDGRERLTVRAAMPANQLEGGRDGRCSSIGEERRGEDGETNGAPPLPIDPLRSCSRHFLWLILFAQSNPHLCVCRCAVVWRRCGLSSAQPRPIDPLTRPPCSRPLRGASLRFVSTPSAAHRRIG